MRDTPRKWIVNGSERTTSVWVEDTTTDKRVCTVTPGDDDLDRARLIAAAPSMHAWLTAHYAIEEGMGKTDRPQYAELKTILSHIKGRD